MMQRAFDFDRIDVVLRWKSGRLVARYPFRIRRVFFAGWADALASVLHPLSVQVRLRIQL